MKAKFISLPNGTVVNIDTIICVTAHMHREAYPGSGEFLEPDVVVAYQRSPDDHGAVKVKCASDADALDLRDRIVARINEHSPIFPV